MQMENVAKKVAKLAKEGDARFLEIGQLLREKLFEGPVELRQAYARLLLSEVSVTREEIRISGSKTVLARCSSTDLSETAPCVLSFV